MTKFLRSAWAGCGLSLLVFLPARADESANWRALVAPDNSLSFLFLRGEDPVFTTGMVGWGPNWNWRPLSSQEKAASDDFSLTVPFAVDPAAGQVITIKQRVWQSADRDISLSYELSSDKDVPLTLLAATLGFDKKFQDGDILFQHTDGSQGTIPLTIGGPGVQGETGTLTFRSKSLGDFTATIDPPQVVAFDGGALRIELAHDLFKAGTKSITITFHTLGNASVVARQSEVDQLAQVLPDASWFPVTATDDVKPSVIGFEGWLDKPAGSHGGVRLVGDHFEFEDKTPVKFWGTNLAYAQCAPEKKQGEYTARRFAKYGINAVRLHKFTGVDWAGIGDPNDSTKMTPDGLDRLDYFANQLAQNGIYYGWSHTYHFTVLPGDKDRLLAYDEIKRVSNGDTYALINYAEDCQDLMIERVVNLLKHRNSYTGKTYAEDPALAYIELQNEDDIFFYTTADVYNKFPTYQKKLQERYVAWLQAKYGTQEALQAAWSDALKPSETLADQNIAVDPSPWEMSSDHLPSLSGGSRQRLLDNAAFLHFVQDAFYTKFVKAIRDAGYQGPLVGSPWQAPSGLPNFYNLKSDHDVGYIDRHNYFGENLTDTMLSQPGSGYLSSGLQQVADRPFGLSEWIHVYPALYSAEGPALLAAYGMGLQGWDASYEFDSMQLPKSYSDVVNNSVWNVDQPSQLGQYPALARMIMRGDVKEGAVIGVRHVSAQNLATGTFDFSDKVVQQGDVKSFGGDTPPEALAAGRLVVKFSDQDEPSTFPDMTKFEKDKVIVSNTGQLTWNYSGPGYFTVDTAGTKAVVGFAQDKKLQLGDWTFSVASPYASIFLTSLEKDKDLSDTKSALLTVEARSSNSGLKYFTIDHRIIDNGQSPILLEPVRAALASGREIAAVDVLDQDGQLTGKTVPVQQNSFSLDTAQDKTIYYEVEFR